MVKRSQPTSTATPMRRIKASREIRAVAGLPDDKTAWLTSASREQAERFRRQGDGKLLPLAHRKIAHQVGGKIRKDGDAGRGLRIEPRAAEGSEKIETDDFCIELVLRRTVEIAHAHLFRP